MSDSSETKQQFGFQAEISKLLHLLSHSLYQSKEIAVRELISNASDALDKMRFIALTDEQHRDDKALEIVLERDEKENVLTIRDNGIGMTHDELVTNLGTIAHSGSLNFLEKLTGDAKKDLSLIGQFGVGFYSAFMLADRVIVKTRSYTETSGWEWESDGTGTFTVAPAADLPRGTSIVLKLKKETEDFAKKWKIASIVKRYSGFVQHPIMIDGEQVNKIKPIWVEPKSKLKDEDYHGFYNHLAHRTDEKPLWHLHLSTDSPIQFHAVIFCPPDNPERLGFHRLDHGLHLCAKRILVQSDNKEILPEYLRFLHGLVDSEDLPLNVSRETLQDNAVFRKIRGTLVKKILDRMQSFADEKPDEYLSFFQTFGPIVKEGVSSDFENKERVAKLLRFQSTSTIDDGKYTSLDEYVARCGEKQKQIYYLGGPELGALRKNPNLEIFKKKGLEVLLLTDPIDEFIVSALYKYADKELASIDSAKVDIPEGIETPDEKKADLPPGGFGKIIDLFKAALGSKIEDVRESKRLTDSPCCLVNPEGGMSSQMQKLMRMANREFDEGRKILEVNPNAALIQRLASLSANPDHDDFIKHCGEQLFASAMLLEGSVVQPEEMSSRILGFMEEAASKRSPLIL